MKALLLSAALLVAMGAPIWFALCFLVACHALVTYLEVIEHD